MMLQDGIVALLAAFGAVTLLWLAASALLRSREQLPVVLVVPLRGQAEEMEYTVRALELQRSRGTWAPILLVDAGMDEDARRRAQVLSGAADGVVLVSPAEAVNYWG